MSADNLVPLIVALLAFLSAGGIVIFFGQRIAENLLVQRRLMTRPGAAVEGAPEGVGQFGALISARIDEKRFGIQGTFRSKLRRDLMRAGYFSENAIRYYIAARLALVICLPIFTLIVVTIIGGDNFYLQIGAVVASAVVGVFGVDAYLSRRQRILQEHHRILFPDLLDMLVVCVDAGLSLDAALARIAPEIGHRSKTLGMNLRLLGSETRAGRSMPDALSSFAERLNLDEVRGFSVLLRQSFELGTDVGDALRVFGDEMRGKRLLRAEEKANKLPVKMVIPMGLCIFPVILMVIMVPVLIRLLGIFHTY